MYQYQAQVLRVIDGDTIEVDIDLGFKIRQVAVVRLAGINAPELSTQEGVAVKGWLVNTIHDCVVTLKTIKDKKEKYGRYLAWVEMPSRGSQEPVCINNLMVELGLAKKM